MTHRIRCTLTDREIAELKSALALRECAWENFDFDRWEFGSDDWAYNGGAWSRKAVDSLRDKLLP